MSTETTDYDKERRAEELADDMMNDFDDFKHWVQEELGHTGGLKEFFILARSPFTENKGIKKLMAMYNTYCIAKAWEEID